jgi:hypothetical protein
MPLNNQQGKKPIGKANENKLVQNEKHKTGNADG